MKCNLFGCKVTISFLFVALITGAIILDETGVLIWGILAAIIHELGHIFAMIFEGDKPDEIKFNLCDIAIIDNKRETRRYDKDIFILLSGSLFNIIFFIVSFILFSISRSGPIYVFSIQNLLLGILNILPIESLDGGQILYILFAKRLSNNKSEILVQVISFVILFPLAVLGFLILLKSKYNFSLLFISLYLMLIILIKRKNFI